MFNPAITSNDPLEILRQLGGYYQCPKDAQGKRLGPLVGYAGKDEDGKNFVGEVYANFGKAEEHPAVLESYSRQMWLRIPTAIADDVTVFCGAPLGGMTFAYQLALTAGLRYVFAEKRILQVASDGQREKSKLVFGRHEISGADNVIIVEDVTNNFSTTDELIRLIKQANARVLGIVSLLNRSLDVSDYYHSQRGGSVPVISLVRKPIAQYRQSDPEVVADVAADNVVWKPKADWDKLMAAMDKHK